VSEQNDKTFASGALLRLARRVLEGDVVFFIGSGFSIDSERNTAPRLMRRLLIRLLAMCESLDKEGTVVQAGLKRTFGLKAEMVGLFPFTPDEINRLADRYYEVNDWFCSAFGRLLGRLAEITAKDPKEAENIWAHIHKREEEIRRGGGQNGTALDHVAFDELPKEFMGWIGRSGGEQNRSLAGKGLFLDTMGFRNLEIMAGRPVLPRTDEAGESFGDRLLPRHHILARFAREGFCTAALTTNYDLLLEGAYRLAGFHHEGCEELAPQTYFNDFARIASPAEFFTKGKAHRTATVVKMHGCTERYRNIPRQDHGGLRAYLRSMIFTYREIQNWREDSWAADYLRTLLRTRTVVFSGYSLRDPVIHDSFRTVYEEMAREKPGNPTKGSTLGTPAGAPAFFLAAVTEPNEFYGMEVLRAASAAVGASPRPLDPHPNYIRFHFRNQPGFPHLDELFRWLFHAVFRLRQQQCLEADLFRVVALLLGRPYPDIELENVRRGFRSLWSAELRVARGWDDSSASRQEHARICSWTDGFGNALLREFACTDQVQRNRGPGRQLALMRLLPWHFPTTQNNGWTCWGAVVELALRRMIATAMGCDDPLRSSRQARAAECMQPTILFPPASDEILPQALTIRFGGFETRYRESQLFGNVRRRAVWELLPGDAPWPLKPRGVESDAGSAVASGRWARGHFCRRAPDAGVIWDWACGNKGSQDEAHQLLGLVEHAYE
jgi:SIR2-like domain